MKVKHTPISRSELSQRVQDRYVKQFYQDPLARRLHQRWFSQTSRIRLWPESSGTSTDRDRGYLKIGCRAISEATWQFASHEMAHLIEIPLSRVFQENFGLRLTSSYILNGEIVCEPQTFQASEREIRVCAIQWHIVNDIAPDLLSETMDHFPHSINFTAIDSYNSPAPQIYSELYAQKKVDFNEACGNIRTQNKEEKERRYPSTGRSVVHKPVLPPEPGRYIREHYIKEEIEKRAAAIDPYWVRAEWDRRCTLIDRILRA